MDVIDKEEKKANILYIDDEKQNLDSFVAAFRRHYNVFTADSAKNAIEILRQHKITIILTDQRMPEMTGVQFLEAVIPEFPTPIRMLVTGYTDTDAIIKAINNGRIFRYISKPWDENELKQSIDLGIKLHELEKENNEVLLLQHEKSYQLERTKNLFSKYVPKNIVTEALVDNRSVSTLFEGERRIISVLFATIHNMDEFHEKRNPQQVHDYINGYFSLMADCIEEYKGTVDKFIGGSMLAIFGAPVSSIENQKNSVFCAISMVERVAKYNVENAGKIGCEIKLGIGIHSGEAVVGNIGSQQYITYTAIGDTVNTAARIVELTKENPSEILITDSVYQMVKDCVTTTLLGEKKMRGKENVTKLYHVINKNI